MTCPHCGKKLKDHPARQLDLCVAKIAGWTKIEYPCHDMGWLGLPPGKKYRRPVPHYSTNIEAAMGLVDSLPKDTGFGLNRALMVCDKPFLWTCTLTSMDLRGFGMGPTAPAAITKAYIAAKENEDGE